MATNGSVDNESMNAANRSTAAGTGAGGGGTLETILSQLINSPILLEPPELENIQQTLTNFIDLRLQTVKLLTPKIRESEVAGNTNTDNEGRELFMKNVLLIIEMISNAANATAAAKRLVKQQEGEPAESTSAAAADTDKAGSTATATAASQKNLLYSKNSIDKVDPSAAAEKEFKRQFSELWSVVMKWEPKPLAVHKRIVTLLPDKIMPFLTKPLHMSDYLLSAFDLGGPMSLLALHGIFVLMLRYNFEIPEFYTKLYSLFQPSIFHAKHKVKFFTSASLFLSSTHLPEALVGGFVKRLARLALLAPTPCLPLIFDFITNLMIQHPGLKVLVDKPPDALSSPSVPTNENVGNLVGLDPFLEDEPDPVKTKAMESSLWEIKSLQHHALASIAKRAKFIDKQLPKLEKDLNESLSYNYEELFKKEMGRKRKKSDMLDTDALIKELETTDAPAGSGGGGSGDLASFPTMKCSRLKGRACMLEAEVGAILF